MLKDCSKINIDEFASAYFGRKRDAIDSARQWLSKLSKRPPTSNQLFKFSETQSSIEPIVYADLDGQWWTGRYIGTLSYEGVSIEILPRFGMDFVANNIPLNNFIPIEISASLQSGDKFIHLLQALLWLNMLTKAARHTLPTVKVDQQHLSSKSKGRIDVRATLKSFRKDKTRIVSVSQYKDINNPITIAIVLAYYEIGNWLSEHNLLNWLPDAVALRLQQMINTIPRHSTVPKPRELKLASLGSLAKAYIPLTRLSMDILRNKGIAEKLDDNDSNTLLFDVAELWEIFVLDALNDAVPTDHKVVHGTEEGNDYLLTDSTGSFNLGKLLPDYILTKNGEEVAIADAKYKRLGDAPWMSPKRDDLYQMTAYLSRYSHCEYGNFFYPDWKENCDITSRNPWHLQSGQKINFITLPTEKQAAVRSIQMLHSEN